MFYPERANGPLREFHVKALAPLLTPQGHLRMAPDAETPPLDAALHDRIAAAFAVGTGHGLLQLDASVAGCTLHSSLAWWRDFAARYMTALCATTEGDKIAVAAPDEAALDALIADLPPITGSEYLTADVLAKLWVEPDAALRADLAASKLKLQEFIKTRYPAWNLVGRVHFNLAENRRDAEAPFSLLATYSNLQ